MPLTLVSPRHVPNQTPSLQLCLKVCKHALIFPWEGRRNDSNNRLAATNIYVRPVVFQWFCQPLSVYNIFANKKKHTHSKPTESNQCLEIVTIISLKSNDTTTGPKAVIFPASKQCCVARSAVSMDIST